MARNGLVLLRYATERSGQDSNAITQINQACEAIHDASDGLIRVIGECLDFEKTELPEETITSVTATALANITTVVTLVEAMKADYVPNKEELIEMLKSFLVAFTRERFMQVFYTIKADQPVFDKQIMLLQDICAEHLSSI